MAKIRYSNLNNVSTDKTLKQFRQLREERRTKKKDYSFVVPSMQPDLAFLHGNRTLPSITWIGHSTFLLQYRGLNIVTDPVWALRMGFQRRIGTPGVPIREIPPIDLILISHSHYDHMHVSSIRSLYKEGTRLIVPEGLKRKLVRKGFSRCEEMSWWEQKEIGGVKLTFVPTQHWTRRTPFDTNSSHWGGFVFEPAEQAKGRETKTRGTHSERDILADNRDPVLYFAGDSGYFDGFKEIGSRFNIDVAMLPIGAYEPEWFMYPQHTTPEEAAQAFLDLKAKLMIPMHYGTFRLADDTAREALDRLEQDRVRRGIPEEQVHVMIHGETLRL